MHTLINKRLLINTAKCLMAMLVACFAFSTTLSATELESENALLAYTNKKNSSKKSTNDYKPVNSWKPYFTWIGNVQDQAKRSFVQYNIGLGFLYFSDVRGNLSAVPVTTGSVNTAVTIPLAGKIGYNRTPVFEYSTGYRIFNWLKVALALEHQNGIGIQTDMLNSVLTGTRISDSSVPKAQLRATLGLNALYPKVTFELPWVMIWKNWLNALYLSVGIGPSWQSWTDIRVYEQFSVAGIETTFVNTLNQKYPANAFWQFDAGIRMKQASISSTFSFLIGCKFSSWGQTRNIGLLSQQGSWGFALSSPFRARMLYSFVPYIGAQWNF